jgi:hypothetical protein
MAGFIVGAIVPALALVQNERFVGAWLARERIDGIGFSMGVYMIGLPTTAILGAWTAAVVWRTSSKRQNPDR